jgi:hypothetical protein
MIFQEKNLDLNKIKKVPHTRGHLYSDELELIIQGSIKDIIIYMNNNCLLSEVITAQIVTEKQKKRKLEET